MDNLVSLLREKNNTYKSKRQQIIEQNKQKEENNSSFLERTGSTLLDIITEPVGGLLKGIEGLIDAGVGLAGGIGGVFGADTKWAEDFIKYSAVDELYYKGFEDDITKNSYLNDAPIVKDVARGIGQMLPAVGVGLLTGGVGSMATLGTSAMGNSTESALNDGSNFGNALAYGAVGGAVEIGTEMLGGKLFGSSVIDDALGLKPASKTLFKGAKTGLGKFAQGAIGEGIEEAVSELSNPLIQNIYKDKGFFDGFLTEEHLKDVGKSFAVGAATSVAFGETVGRINRSTQNANETLSELKTLETREENLHASNKLFEGDMKTKIDNLRNDLKTELSQNVSKMNDKQRAEFIKRNNLSSILNADGSLIENSDNTNNLDSRYHSVNVKGKEQKIVDSLNSQGVNVYSGEMTQEEMSRYTKFKKSFLALSRKGLVRSNFVISDKSTKFDSYLDGDVVVFGKDVFESDIWQQKLIHEIEHFTEGSKEWVDFATFMLNEINLNEATISVLTKDYGVTQEDVASLGENLKNGNLTNKQKLYISEVLATQSEYLFSSEQMIERLSKSKRNLAQKILERIKGFIDVIKAKTPEEKEFIKKLQKAENLFEKALERAGTGYILNNVTKAQNLDNDNENLYNETNSELAEVSYARKGKLGYNKTKKYISSNKIGVDNWKYIDSQVQSIFKGVRDGIANSIAIEKDDVIYIVDSGKDDGNISFGVRKVLEISDENLRKAYVKELNNDAISKGYVSDEVSSKLGNEYDNSRRSNRGQELGKELSTNTRESSDNEGRVSGEDGYRGRGVLNNKNYSLKDNLGNELSKEQAEFFKDSKVRDENGNLLVMYHGTTSGEFTVFDTNKSNKAFHLNNLGVGNYFTSSYRDARIYSHEDKGRIIKAYLNIKKPYRLKKNGRFFSAEILENIAKEAGISYEQLIAEGGRRAVNNYLQKLGYDGVIFETDKEFNMTAVTFHSNQIKNIDNKKPTLNEDIRFALKDSLTTLERYSDNEKLSILSNKSFKVAETYEDIKEFITKSRNLKNNELLFIGKISKEYANRIEKETSLDVKNKSIALSSDDIRHIFNNHSPSSEKLRGQIVVDINNIEDIIETIIEPDSIERSSKNDIDSIIFKKNINGNITAVTILSNKKKTLTLKSAWITKNKQYISPSPDVQASSFTSATLGSMNTVYVNSISNKNENVNTNSKNDKRHSLKDGNIGYNYSKGQISKYVAEHSKLKAYTRADAEQTINTIVANQLSFGEKYGDLSNKTEQQAISTLWHALNTNDEGYRIKTALDIADYIIDNAVMKSVYEDAAYEDSLNTIAALKPYLHKLNLSSIKDEIKYKYDKNAIAIYGLWGRRKGAYGTQPDVLPGELESYGIRFESDNAADILFELDLMYRNALKHIKKGAKEKLTSFASEEELKELKQNIAKEILRSYDTTGHETKFARLVEKYTKKISALKKAINDIKAYTKAEKDITSTITRMNDKFVKNKPAGWEVPQQVVDFVKKISRVKTWRNNLSKNIRTYIGNLENTIDLVMDKSQQEIYPYREIIREMASGEGELTAQELIMLNDMLNQFEWQLNSYDKVYFEGREQSITELSTQGVEETKQAKTILGSGSNVLIKFKNKVYTNPYDRLAEMGLYNKDSIAMKFYSDMLNGDSKRAGLVKQVNDMFNEFFKDNKNYLKDLQQELTIGGVKLTKRQALSLYCTSLREQGRNHLFNETFDSGVVHILDNELSTKGKMLEAFADGQDITITADMIEEIKSSLTDADKEYLKIVDKFFNKISKETKSETDKMLYGITNVEDGYYFPIKVSNDKIYTNAGQNDTNINQYILSLGMNKSTKPNANNKIVIDGIDNIISNHLQNLSLYYGYAVPLTAYNRIMNKQVDTFDGRDITSNMRAEIQKIDVHFEGYMNTLWQDVQGIRKGDKGFISQVLSKVRWATSSAALGANPKVLVTQTLSLASAISEFDSKHIAKGMAHFFGEKEKLELAKYSPLMWERMEIGNSTDIAEIRQIGKEIGTTGKLRARATKFINNFTTKPISWMDSNVIQSLWFAAQYEVAETKGLEFGTEANKIEAGKRLDEVVFRTQQTSDPLGRSEWMRSQNEFVKFARMFTGDALQLTGRLIASVNKYRIAKKMINSGNSKLVQQGQAMLKDAKVGVTKASSAFLLNQVMLLAIAMAFKWIKGKDDEEEWSDIAKNEFTANLMGLIPFGGDIYDKLSGYEPTNMAYTALSNSVEVVQDTWNGISNWVKGDYESEVHKKSIQRKTLLSISRLLGIPLQNLESYMKGIIGHISPATREEYEANFKLKSNTQYFNKIRKATEDGNEELADSIINIMFDSRTGKIKDDKVLETKRNLIELGYDVIPKSVGGSISYDGVEYNLTSRQHDRFMKIYSEANNAVKTMVNTSAFNKLEDGAKAKAMNFVYDYYYNLAIEDMLGEDLETKTILFAEAVPIEQLAMAISQAQMYSADTKNGKVIAGTKKAKVQSFIQGLRLTAAQKYIIMGYLGYLNKFGESLVESYINRLDLTKSQKKSLFEMSGYVA